jgi:4-phytase/acid phosphatase
MKPFRYGCMILGALLILFDFACLALAQSPTPNRSSNPANDSHSARENNLGELRLTVILSRHGVRSPTWTQARLNAYSAKPWPNWGVPPGYLTAHGFEQMKKFGSFDRASLAAAGLVAADGCADRTATYIWADTDQRTLESGRALAEGMFPGCPPTVHSLAAGANDPLFHPNAARVREAQTFAGVIQFDSTAKKQPDTRQDELLIEMQNVLLGCSPTIRCTPAREPEILLGGPSAAGRETGDRPGGLPGPLPQASSFSEDFLLEYADGMPDSEVGWGNVDETELRRFLSLHSDYFHLVHRAPALARLQASNMLFHITRTLEQCVKSKAIPDALGPPDSKIVVLIGHDTNLAALAALLGVHWSLDGREDDTPPGSELALELWRSRAGTWSVRVTVAMQTLGQLREIRDLTLAAPPARETLQLPGCGTGVDACSWASFLRIGGAAIDKASLLPAPSK